MSEQRLLMRGLAELVEHAVDATVRETERLHRSRVRRTYAVLERIGPIAPAAKGIELIQDAITAGVYEAIRATNRVVGMAAAVAIDTLDLVTKHEHDAPSPPESLGPATLEPSPSSSSRPTPASPPRRAKRTPAPGSCAPRTVASRGAPSRRSP